MRGAKRDKNLLYVSIVHVQYSLSNQGRPFFFPPSPQPKGENETHFRTRHSW